MAYLTIFKRCFTQKCKFNCPPFWGTGYSVIKIVPPAAAQYWDDNLSEKEIEEQKGNAKLISDLIPKVKTEDIERYLVRWNLDSNKQKAYSDDEFENIDWQIVDFMKKVGLEYPIDDMGKPIGTVFRFWTEEYISHC